MSVNYTHTHEPTVTIKTGAYASGRVAGGLLDLTVLCGGGGGGVIRDLIVYDDANQALALDIYFFDKKPVAILDDGVFATAIDFSELAKLKKKVSVAAADYIAINSNAIAVKDGLAISHGTGELWAYIVTNSTPTYGAATALRLRVTGWKD